MLDSYLLLIYCISDLAPWCLRPQHHCPTQMSPTKNEGGSRSFFLEVVAVLVLLPYGHTNINDHLLHRWPASTYIRYQKCGPSMTHTSLLERRGLKASPLRGALGKPRPRRSIDPNPQKTWSTPPCRSQYPPRIEPSTVCHGRFDRS